MRIAAALLMAFALPALAQDQPPQKPPEKARAKKPAPKIKPAHEAPTPEQIRRFNELEKKRSPEARPESK